MQKHLGYSFYKVEGTELQIAVTSGEDWKDITIFKHENGKVVMLPVESNEFCGKHTYREIWSQVKYLKSFDAKKIQPIDEEKASPILKEYVKDFISNRKGS